MKMNTAVNLLKLLPSRRENAVTTSELALQWVKYVGQARHRPGATPSFDALESSWLKPTSDSGLDEAGSGLASPDDESINRATSSGKEKPDATLRAIQRWVKDLSDSSSDDPYLLEKTEDKPPKYYLKMSRVADWFMSEKAALNLLLTRQVLAGAFGTTKQLGMDDVTELASEVAGNTLETRRIRSRLRVVPDGIGRLQSFIEPLVLEAAIQCVAEQVRFTFQHSYRLGEPSSHTVSVHGLVAKDGTIYLLGTTEFSDSIERFGLHRVANPEVTRLPARQPDHFDLDSYIDDSHQLSHKLDDSAPPVKLKLRVAPQTVYHFRDRALSADQKIEPSRGPMEWQEVTATVPNTILLAPFLLSMGGWIEVLEPLEVRTAMSERVHAMAAHYPQNCPA